MATILRVKRRNEDEPLEALVFACKRRKTEDANDVTDFNSSATVVKFAGTIQNQDDNVEEHVAKALMKEKLESNLKARSSEAIQKARLQVKEDSKQSRYKVVNCYRALDSLNIKELDNKKMTVIDVEDSISCSEQKLSDKQDENYVYDLYYTPTDQEINSDDLFSIRPFDHDLNFEEYRGNKSDTEDSDDSNSESNWRNDYPDSDNSDDNDGYSVDEDDIRTAVQRIKIDGEESDLSSEDPDFLYCVDESDVEKYGYKYAKYKAKVLNEDVDEESHDEDDDYENEENESEIESDNYDSECSGVRITELTSDED